MLRILALIGLTLIASLSSAYAQKATSDNEKIVCKDSSDPRCMSE